MDLKNAVSLDVKTATELHVIENMIRTCALTFENEGKGMIT